MARRGYKGGTAATTLAGDINDTVTTIAAASLATWAGLTSNGPGTATINRGKSDEETITFTGISTNNLTGVTRGAAGTTQQAHSSGATIEQTSSVTDFDEANAHIFDTTRDDHTQYLKKSVATTKGDLFVATGAGTIVRLGVGTDGQAVIADAASAGGLKYATVGGGLLSHVQYAPDPAHDYSYTSTTIKAVDTTNMRLPDFVGPASGLVRVTMAGFIFVGATGNRPGVCIITQGGIVPVGALATIDTGAVGSNGHTFFVEQYITVTPGTTYHWDMGWQAGGAQADIYAYGGVTATTLGAPLVCSVFAT